MSSCERASASHLHFDLTKKDLNLQRISMARQPKPQFRLAIKGAIDFNPSVILLKPLKSVGIALFLLTIVGTSLDQWITLKMETQLMSPQGAGPIVWAFGGLSMILNIAYPLIFLLITLAAFSQKNAVEFLKKNLNQSLIEEMRAWGKSMLWSLALILPGFLQFMRLIFVPFVTTLDSEYAAGNVDALVKSKLISRGQLSKIIALFVLFSIIVPAMLTSLDEYKLLWKTPVSALAICFLEMILNLCFILGLWKLYHQGQMNRPQENS